MARATKDRVDSVRQAWAVVKRDYFPRWDRMGEWRLSFRPPSRARWAALLHGLCDTENRRIFIAAFPADEDARDALLIHEICHAVATGFHGRPWQRRMGKAAARARALGRPGLGTLLEDEVRQYSELLEWGAGTAREAYGMIKDLVTENPDLKYGDVKKAVAFDLTLSPDQFGRIYKRAPKVYEAARRDTLKRRKLREAALAEWARQQEAGAT